MGAVPSNTLNVYDLTGTREHIEDEISILTPIDSPFYHGCGAASATAMKHEFMTDEIESPAQNKALIGSDPTIDASVQPVKIYNNIQLQEKSFAIADSSEAITTVGNSGGYDYQKALKMKALVGDMEWAFLREVRVDGAAGTAPTMRGLLNWITTNIDKAADAVLNADGTVTGGTAREFTKDLTKNVMQDIYSAGGGGANKTMTAYCGSFQKDKFDQFLEAGGSNRRAVDKNKLDDKIDLYVTSWGTVKAEIHRTMPTDNFVIFDPSFWKKATLIPVGIEELAKSSRSNRKFHMTVQHTLEAKNEKSAGRITDLTTS
jgi:hypothetical protein